MRAIFQSVIFLPLFASLLPLYLQASPRIAEAFQQGEFSPSYPTTETLITLNFSIDTACVVQFATGGIVGGCRVWLKLDSDSLPLGGWIGDPSLLSIIYAYPINEGAHTIVLVASGTDGCKCSSAYLQALIFEPDSGNAVCELPVPPDASPQGERVYRIGEAIGVQTSTAIYDASGRLVERPLGFWIPQTAGIYYITGESRIRKVIVQ